MKAPSKAECYRGVPTAPYDLLKEISVAMLISLVIIVVLSAVISSPDAAQRAVAFAASLAHDLGAATAT